MKKRLYALILLPLCLTLSAVMVYAASIAGTWTLYYDWDCNGGYGSTTMTLSSNNTWTSSGGYTGTWTNVEKNIIIEFDTANATKYSGSMIGGAMIGMMNNNPGSKGCWYMVKQGYSLSEKEMSKDDDLDAAGE